MRVRLRELENVPLQKLKIASIMMRLFILQVPKQIKNYILRKLPQQKRAQLLCNHSRERLYLLVGLKWVWKSFFFFQGGSTSLLLLTFYRLGKLRHKKMKRLAQDHRKGQQQSQKVKLSLLTSSPGFWNTLSLRKQFDSLLPPLRLSAELRRPTGQRGRCPNLSTNKRPPRTCGGPARSLQRMEIHGPVCLPFGWMRRSWTLVTRISSWRSQTLNGASSTS